MLRKKITLIAISAVLVSIICSTYTILPVLAVEKTEGIWNSVNFVDATNNVDTTKEAITNKLIDTTVYDEKLYIATSVSTKNKSDTSDRKNKIYVQAYDGQNWSNIGEEITVSKTIKEMSQLSFCNRPEGLYLFYSTQGLLEICKLDTINNQWVTVTSISDIYGSFGIATERNTTYITAISSDQSIAKIYNFDGNNLTEDGIYFEHNGIIDEPKAAILNGTLYISLRELGSPQISLYSYVNGQAKKIECSLNAYSYTMSIVNEDTGSKLYIAATTTDDKQMIIHSYDGTKWTLHETGLEYETHYPEMVAKSGEIYILALFVDNKLQTYTYSKSTGQFVKQGEDVDDSAIRAQAIAFKDYIYTAYQDENTLEIRVKRKEYLPDYYRGDINQDGSVNIRDVILGAKALVGLETLTPEQEKIGHVTTKLNYFNLQDIIRICKYLVGNIETL